MSMKLRNALSGLVTMIGIILVMGAVGADDYAALNGLEGPSLLVTIGKAALGIGIALVGYLIWAGGKNNG